MNLEFLTDSKFALVLLGIGSVAVFLFVLSIFFYIYDQQDQKKFSHKIKEYNEEFYLQTLKDIQNNKTTKTVYEKLDLLLSKSQLKFKYSWNVGLFVALVISSFFVGYFTSRQTIGSIGFSLIVGFIIGFLPFIMVEFLSNRNNKKLKGQILSFIPVLINNAKLTGGDIFKTLKKSAGKVNDPLQTYLYEFVEEYEHGISPSVCFQNLRDKIPDYKFTRIIDCLETHLYKGGNVIITLGSINKEYLAREIEDDRRRKANSTTALGIYISVACNVIILYIVNLVLPEITEILMQQDLAMILVLLNIVVSLIIAYMSTKIQRKEGA